MSPISGPALVSSSRRVRVKFGGQIIAGTKRVLLFRQYGRDRLPAYYFARSDVRTQLLAPGSVDEASGDRAYYTLQVGSQMAENAAWMIPDPPADVAGFKGHFSFAWSRQA
jgi:uncharacterized protein (DUF427 family)